MLYEPAGLSLHFLFIYTRSFVAPDFLKTSRHTSQQKGGQRRSFSKRFLVQAPVIIMKIIDSHLHFCPGYPHFDEIAIEAGHINNEEHLRECFQKYNIVGGIVMGNRGVHPDNHTYPASALLRRRRSTKTDAGKDSEDMRSCRRKLKTEYLRRHQTLSGI